ncbi:MAG: low specificity L-threonine aldolase, partial [Muribaculaceae bacterium]|nr:low specificity L-threonine aldolase [Muribaculaceae bacterium]
MIKFQCDYMEGAHPEIMRRLNEINLDKNDGYGLDHYSAHAMQLIREACQCPKAEVRFLVGGTQTNA